MDWRQLATGDDGRRTFVVIGDEGDDAAEILNQFAREHNLAAAQVTAVGAFSQATVGWFDRAAKDYRRIEVDEQCELLSLIGDFAASDKGPVAHLHAVLGMPNGHVRGGHLLSGKVMPTLEVIVDESPGHLKKTQRPDLGLALIDLPASSA